MVEIEQEWIDGAQAAMKTWKIPASITLGQFGLESGWGQHMPAGSNNPFGIKALPGQPYVNAMTREEDENGVHRLPQPFRRFASLAEAFDYHARLLATSDHYAHARTFLANTAIPMEARVESFVSALVGVYATDHAYFTELMGVIRGDKLSQYDNIGLLA